MRVLVIDIGGNNVKLAVPGRHDVVKVPSGPLLTARRMLASVRRATAGWDYDVVSIGYPGVVVNGLPAEEPVNLGKGWVGFGFESAFGRPVRFINDAAMQALGSYEGGRMLFLGLGTGLGMALVVDGTVLPLEVQHLPFRKGRSYEEHVGRAGFERFGRKRWRELVAEVTGLLKHALQADYVVLGGGNVKELRQLPPGARAGANSNAILGGVRLWETPAWATAAVHSVAGAGSPKKASGRRRVARVSGKESVRPSRTSTAAPRASGQRRSRAASRTTRAAVRKAPPRAGASRGRSRG